MEGSALANAIRPGDGDIVEGPTTTAPVVSLRSDEAAAQVTQSGAPEGETGLVDVLDEASSLVWPELFDHGEGEVPPPEPPENAGSRIAVIPTSAPVASPRFDENQSDTGRAEHPQAWSADDTAVPPIESARSDEAGAQILRFETPHEAEAEEPEIRRSSLAMPSTTTVGPPSSEPDGSAIAEPERPEAQGNNIVALPNATSVLPPRLDAEEDEVPEPRKISGRGVPARDPLYDPEQFARPRSLSESLTECEREAYDEDSPEKREGVSEFMRRTAGSEEPAFNLALVTQVLRTVPVEDGEEMNDRHRSAAGAALRGIAPQDETEGMLAAQIVGLHNVSMEFLRRAIREIIPFGERREYANLAIKLSRAFNHSCETLNRIRGKAPPSVNVGHVNVAGGAQAIVGIVNRGPGKDAADTEPGSIEHEPSAPVRRENAGGKPCQGPAVTGKARCRMHGGAPGSGAPRGNKNALKHGRFSAEARARRRQVRLLIEASRKLTETLNGRHSE
jgi:hypothetical protein